MSPRCRPAQAERVMTNGRRSGRSAASPSAEERAITGECHAGSRNTGHGDREGRLADYVGCRVVDDHGGRLRGPDIEERIAQNVQFIVAPANTGSFNNEKVIFF